MIKVKKYLDSSDQILNITFGVISGEKFIDISIICKNTILQSLNYAIAVSNTNFIDYKILSSILYLEFGESCFDDINSILKLKVYKGFYKREDFVESLKNSITKLCDIMNLPIKEIVFYVSDDVTVKKL